MKEELAELRNILQTLILWVDKMELTYLGGKQEEKDLKTQGKNQ